MFATLSTIGFGDVVAGCCGYDKDYDLQDNVLWVIINLNLNNYFKLHICQSFRVCVCVSVQRPTPIPAGESINVTNKSCYICLRGDKNALRVIS